jgi:hypothetical protein
VSGDQCVSAGCEWEKRGDALDEAHFELAPGYPPEADFKLTLCSLHMSALMASIAARVHPPETTPALPTSDT